MIAINDEGKVGMAGTLLVYDDAFPRSTTAAGPTRNTPSDAELRSNSYPEPFRLLPIWQASSPDTYFQAMSEAAETMKSIDRFIIFGHGRVVQAAEGASVVAVTTGIVIGAQDITASNASGLRPLRNRFARGGSAELWVCSAADSGQSAGYSGTALCQSISDALGVDVIGATITQQYTTADQHEIPTGGWQSTAQFLPWEGTTQRFTPRPAPRAGSH